MAIIYWTNLAGTNFGTASNWSADTVPDGSDQARINDGANVVASGGAVLSLTTNAGASLGISAGQNFTMLEGTGIGANAGEINIFDGAVLAAGGTIDNTGAILLVTTGDSTQLVTFPSEYLTLSGSGQVFMTGNDEVDITTNVSNTITGAGTVSLSNNEKNGVINAVGPANKLVVNTSSQTLINAGTLEATGPNGLLLNGTINGSSGGLIKASAGFVYLSGVTLIGGTLESSSGGNILISQPSTFDGISATVNNEATLQLFQYTLSLEGIINNTGQIDVDGSDMAIDAAGATLEGSGTILVSGSIISNAPSAKLTNVSNTVSGFGVIGDSGSNTMTFVNHAKGVIDGNGDFLGAPAAALVIDTGTNAITNTGTLEATFGVATGELYIASPVTNSGGKLIANDGELVAAGAVTGGTDTIEGTGTVEFGAASSALTTFALGSTGGLILDDAAQYTGTVSGFGKNTAQSIDLPNVQIATVSKTYSGGVLTVKDTFGDVAHIKLSGSYTLASFTPSNDGHGGTLITDPPVAKTTHTTGVDIAMLGSYIASSLVGESLGLGGSLTTDASALMSPPLLAIPGHA